MRIVMTLVVRDEAEIIRDQLDYHLAAGVDLVIATDHRSVDGTREILEGYERRGALRLLREDGEHIRQGEWQTRMSRLAAVEHDADWVLVSDADEFWFGRGASLGQTLQAVPENHGVVRASMLNFVPVRDGDGSFVERMTFRLVPPAAINDPATPYRPVVKVAHRADSGITVARGGGHSVTSTRWSLLTGWHPLDLLHFPIRSREQCERKYLKTRTGWESNLRADLAKAADGMAGGRADLVWASVALDQAELARGLEEGALLVDTRLRDALLSVRHQRDRSPHPTQDSRSSRANSMDVAVFEEAELVRRARWLGDLESRVRALETAVA